jgi:hypothetical protein
MAVKRGVCVELKACGPDDPDGLRAATILSAYFCVERMRAFRKGLWLPLAVAAVPWAALAVTTLLSRSTIVLGFVVLTALACGAAVLEWRAKKRLTAVLTRFGSSAQVTRY